MKQNKGLWIPEDFFRIASEEKLKTTEVHILATIYGLSKEEPCFASNKYFAERFFLKNHTVSVAISELKKKDLVVVELFYKAGTKEVEKRLIRPSKKLLSLLKEPEKSRKEVVEEIYNSYPKKDKEEPTKIEIARRLDELGEKRLRKCVEEYIKTINQENRSWQYIKSSYNFFFEGYEDYII